MDIKTIQALALAKKYADDLLKGQGAIKGEKGDPFTYEDFTEEQLNSLKGNPGVNGKSAYEIALKNGFSGSEEEWLMSLNGKDGDSISIGENGNWYIGDKDTGINASNVNFNAISPNNIDSIISQTSILNDNLDELPVKYYKIEFNSIYSTNEKPDPISAAITELEFYDSNGNKVLPFLISASSVYQDSDTYSANKLIDGKFNTMWSSKNIDETHWIKIIFSNPIILSKIKIAPRNGMEYGVPDIISFYASEEGTFWYQIGNFNNLKSSWIDQNTFQDFNVEPFKTDLSTNKLFLDFNGLKYYHMHHGALKANINSPALTGTPTSPTNTTATNNSNQIATNQFVQNAFSYYMGGRKIVVSNSVPTGTFSKYDIWFETEF